MLGVIYLIISEMIGYETTKVLLESRESQTVGNRIWLILPSSFGVGTLILTWAVYIISWFCQCKRTVRHTAFLGKPLYFNCFSRNSDRFTDQKERGKRGIR